MKIPQHPILEQSFKIIDQEIGEHNFKANEYAIVRRVIHSTADFELAKLIQFSPDAIASGIKALRQGVPIITDVNMVKQGVISLVEKSFNNPLISAIDQVSDPLEGKTRTETGLINCWQHYPDAIFVFGNAPTALLALCDLINKDIISDKPALVIGAPVGFVSVVESKQALSKISVPQIRIDGRKGGSPAASAILNALIVLACN